MSKINPLQWQRVVHIAGAMLLTGVGGALGQPAVLASGAALTAQGISDFLEDKFTADPSRKAAVERAAKAVEENLRFPIALGEEVDTDVLSRVVGVLTQEGHLYWPSNPKVIAALVTKPQGWSGEVAKYVVEGIAENSSLGDAELLRSETGGGNVFARSAAISIIETALDAALAEPAYWEKIEPTIIMTILGTSAEILREVKLVTSELKCAIRTDGERTRDRIDQTTERQNARLKSLEETLADLVLSQTGKRVEDVDATYVEQLRRTLKNLRKSTEPHKHKASELLNSDPKRDAEAISILVELGEKQDKDIEAAEEHLGDVKLDAATTWRQVGVLTLQNETHKSLEAWSRVIDLLPEDIEAWNACGLLQTRLGNHVHAIIAFNKVISLGGQKENAYVKAVAFSNLGLIENIRGNLKEARKYYRQALFVFQALGKTNSVASILGNLGNVERILGNLAQAERNSNQSLKIFQNTGDKSGVAGQLGNLGLIAQARGDLDKAEEYLQRSLALNEELDLKEGVARDLGNLGGIKVQRGDFEGARNCFQRALEFEKELGRKQGIAKQLGNLGQAEHKIGSFDSAKKYHLDSLALHEQLQSKEGMAINYNDLGYIEWERGNIDGAANYLKKGIALNEELGSKDGVAGQLDSLGLIERALGSYEEAEKRHRQSIRVFEELGYPAGKARALGNLALVERDRGNRKEACELLKQSRDMFVEMGLVPQADYMKAMMIKAGCSNVL